MKTDLVPLLSALPVPSADAMASTAVRGMGTVGGGTAGAPLGALLGFMVGGPVGAGLGFAAGLVGGAVAGERGARALQGRGGGR
jgi:hypothetical protein